MSEVMKKPMVGQTCFAPFGDDRKMVKAKVVKNGRDNLGVYTEVEFCGDNSTAKFHRSQIVLEVR